MKVMGVTLRRGDDPEAFPGEWPGREVRVAGGGVAEPERASGKDAPWERPERVAPRRYLRINMTDYYFPSPSGTGASPRINFRSFSSLQ